jgi:hypothetical protein
MRGDNEQMICPVCIFRVLRVMRIPGEREHHRLLEHMLLLNRDIRDGNSNYNFQKPRTAVTGLG